VVRLYNLPRIAGCRDYPEARTDCSGLEPELLLKEETMQRTLSIIKPDGVAKNLIGEVIRTFETEGFKVAAMKMKTLSKTEAEGFYYVHKERPFFGELANSWNS
jgi:hypothetical protein